MVDVEHFTSVKFVLEVESKLIVTTFMGRGMMSTYLDLALHLKLAIVVHMLHGRLITFAFLSDGIAV